MPSLGAEGHSIAHENTMNAIAALPSLTVAPRARVTRKVAAKARAVRPDPAGRGDERSRTAPLSRIFPEWLGCVESARSRRPRDAPTCRDPRGDRATHTARSPPLHPRSPRETQARFTVMAQKQVRLGRAIHAHPRTRDPRQRGSLDILGARMSPSPCVSSPRFFPPHVRVFLARKKDTPLTFSALLLRTRLVRVRLESRSLPPRRFPSSSSLRPPRLSRSRPPTPRTRATCSAPSTPAWWAT
jgi:hypothetical protein